MGLVATTCGRVRQMHHSGVSPLHSLGASRFTPTGVLTVPEPSAWAMMLLGFAGLGFVGYRQTRRAKLRAA
jgi:PEP-CTERM motif